MSTLNWGFIGTGAIAKAFAHGLSQTESGKAVAVGSRTTESANAFGDMFGIPNRHDSYESLLSDEEVQAVYISTPHPFHGEWTIRAAEAGKHVLCEKPFGLNHGQGMAMVEAARENGVFLMEAFMYRCHPQTQKLAELIRDGVIGDVRMIRATFGFGGGNTINPASRLFDKKMGGGAILDVGGYPISMSRLIAGAAVGMPFDDPIEVVAAGKLGETGVDEWAAAVLNFDSGIVAQVATAVRVSPDNSLHIYGSDGMISVPDPWKANRKQAEPGSIIIQSKDDERTIEVPADRTSFAYEADMAAGVISTGGDEAEWPGMTWDDTLGNLGTLDKWRNSIGLVYDAELEKENRPLRGTVKRRIDSKMKYGRIEGLDKPVSVFIMGCDNQLTFAHGAALWDDWFERGGNAFDTSWVYGGGRQEVLLGNWIKSRGVRSEVVVAIKGAHTPRCVPDLLKADFLESLERLQFDAADLYMMHRDNPEIPVGEFVDVLNELKDDGLLKGAFGGSNCSIERFKAANTYAESNGKQGFAVLSNNLSLARMVKPVWGGCIHLSDSDSRKWLEDSNTTNLSWSSQARGYFLPESSRMKLGRDNFECWDAPDNRERRARAEELAAKRNCSPINIAAAYVIGQPFPSFALIGPRTIHETATTLNALDVELTRDEIEWLWG